MTNRLVVGMRNNPIVCHRQFNIYRQEFDEENIVYNYLEENIYRAVELDQQEHLNNLLLAKKALLEHERRQ
jgi:hypothetical protein